MRLKNPLVFEYPHPNFNGNVIESSLNDVGSDEGTLVVDLKAPDGRVGQVQLQMQDNGNVRFRFHLVGDGSSVAHVLVVGDGGVTLFEG